MSAHLPSEIPNPPCLLLRVRAALESVAACFDDAIWLKLTADLPQLPAGGGILPYWLLITSVASIYNVAQNYVTLKQSKEIYSGKEAQSESTPQLQCAARREGEPGADGAVTPLAGRLFGAWTAMAAAIRLLAAYDISNKGLYDLGIVAFGVATFHFVSEWLVFGTVKPNRASIGPLVIGCEPRGQFQADNSERRRLDAHPARILHWPVTAVDIHTDHYICPFIQCAQLGCTRPLARRRLELRLGGKLGRNALALHARPERVRLHERAPDLAVAARRVDDLVVHAILAVSSRLI